MGQLGATSAFSLFAEKKQNNYRTLSDDTEPNQTKPIKTNQNKTYRATVIYQTKENQTVTSCNGFTV